jgi:hypothetical protein
VRKESALDQVLDVTAVHIGVEGRIFGHCSLSS